MTFSWLAVDASTGYPLDDVPDFSVDSASIIIGQPQTAIGSYPVASDRTPPDWVYSTDEMSTAMILLDDMAPDPVAGWYISGRTRDHTNKMRLSMVTGEGVLDRKFVRDATFAGIDQNTIGSTLVTNNVVAAPSDSSGMTGHPFIINVIGAAGAPRDRVYADINDTTVLNALTELSGVMGGPEFTVTWRHLTNPERYLPVFNIGTRIGTPATAGLSPSAVFEMGGTSPGGSVTEITYTEDYTAGRGANYVTATGATGADNTRLKQTAYQGGGRRPVIEYRWNPSTSIGDASSSAATLAGHASSALAAMGQGSRSLVLKSDATTGPRLGYDWFLGDDVGYSIGGLDAFGRETVPAFPGGLSGIARAIGWTIDPDAATPTVTPILGSV